MTLKNNDSIKFGKEDNVYNFEMNSKTHLGNSNALTENDNTVVYPSIIKDDRISLVNEEFYTKATRNHFDRKVNEKISNINTEASHNLTNQNNTNIASQKLPSINPLQSSQNEMLDSPKFNSSIREDNNNMNDLDMTFKNSKKNLINSKTSEEVGNLNSNQRLNKNTKLYEELYAKIENFSKENENISNHNYELEEKILEKTNECKKLTNSLDQINEEYAKLNAKHNALLIFASDLQKKVDYLEIQVSEKNEELQRYTGMDWGKLLLEKENTVKVLQSDLNLYKQELQKIKANLLSNSQKGGYVNDITKRIDSLLDTYVQENKKLKKVMEEYKLRENECSKKWNELLKENNTNLEKINLLHQQLNGQTQHFNNIISDYDKRLVDTFNKIPRLLEQFDSKKSEAAQYLVEQTNFIMEEKRKLLEDNNLMESKIEMQNFENEKLRQEIKHLSSYMEPQGCFNNNMYNSFNSGNFNSNNINYKQMRVKIEELEDLLTEYKNTSSPNKIIELEETIISLNNRLTEKDKQIEQLNNKLKEFLKRTNMVFDEKQAITSLSQAMREKDIVIINLRNQIRDMRDIEKVKNNEIDNLSRIVERQTNDNSKSCVIIKMPYYNLI